jgi:hemerythrin-like domain-containing protein
MYPLIDLLEATADSATLDEIKTKVACLRSMLVTHAGIEDAILRPAIQAYLAPPPPPVNGEPAPTDHQAIDLGLEQVLAAHQAAEARRLLRDTLEHTRRHFAKEEHTIFDLAERRLSPALQEELGARWAALRGVFLHARSGE